MGTLTANDTRLPGQCEHKLPTSCRLSSLPNCCACADERTHAPSYSTYIDGIGFVPRGNRWQRYCWYCKVFWENRVEVSGLRPAQTKIPEIPDQKEFLERWYEFHRGYRIVTNSNGEEERIAVVGERFMDVTPGCLPRTLVELREGRQAEEVQQRISAISLEAEEDTGPSLEETLDSMFTDAVNEQSAQPSNVPTAESEQTRMPAELASTHVNVHAQAMNSAAIRNREYQHRRIAALRRELTRMRTGIERVISGLRELGENVPDETESVSMINRLDEIIQAPAHTIVEQAQRAGSNDNADSGTDLQTRIRNARRQVDEARLTRDHAALELETSETLFQDLQRHLLNLQRDHRTMENYMRVFGTREEMLAQGENYESPIGGMFTRAMERFRAAEDVRREERTLRQVLEDEARIDTNEAVARRLEELETRERDVWGVPRSLNEGMPSSLRVDVRDYQFGARADPAPIIVNGSAGNPVQIPSEDAHDLSFELDATGDRMSDTPPYLADTNEESVLQEYYSLIRRQDWSQQPGEAAHDILPENEANFPQNMLNAIVSARAREVAETGESELQQQTDLTTSDDIAVVDTLPPSWSEDEWWNEDAGVILQALTTDDSIREALDMTPADATRLLAYFNSDYLTETDRMTIDSLLRDETAIWQTGLPSEWLKRRAELVQVGLVTSPGFFTGEGGYGGSEGWARHHNYYMRIELIAQAFMTSSEIRRVGTSLTPPERLQMLYRLQSGRRTESDLRILQEMENEYAVYLQALVVYRNNLRGNDEPATELINATRMERARSGNHSRQALDARRNDASNRAFALAAGRLAMRTGSQAVMDGMATANANANEAASNEQEAGTRAAFHRLRTSGFTRRPERATPYRQLTLSDYLESSAGSSRSSSPEASRGLDARDSGRPEPKSEEDLLVSMECKICYTQTAEVACLPCGHLVMCRWCSDQHSPCMNHDRTRPRKHTACPVCRKRIVQKVRVFRA